MTNRFMKRIQHVLGDEAYRNVYFPFIWHGFFLAVTMAMIELNTVLPNLIAGLTQNNIAFGGMYSIMLGAPMIFNLLFSNYLKGFKHKKKFLLFGIYLRSFSFLGMALAMFFLSGKNPLLTLALFYGLILLFSISGGFAGIAYSDMVGKLLPSERRPRFFATRQIVSGIASLLGGSLITRIFSPGSLDYPLNYGVALLIGGMGLMVGAMGYWTMKEPPSAPMKTDADKEGLIGGTVKILRKDYTFRKFIIIENITGFSLMILPFYMVFVKQSFADYQNYFGAFVMAQIIGNILSNLFWAGISKKLGTAGVLKICILLGASVPITAILLQPLGAAWYVVVFFLVGMITSGRSMGFEPYLLDIAPDDQRTMYLGIRGTLNILVILLPLAGGFFISLFGYTAAFAMVSAVMIGAFLMLKNHI